MSAAPPFLWNQIESADYAEYVSNLRAIGCPELLIRDLVTAELNQLFAPQFAELWPQRCPLYWQKRVNETPDLERAKRLQVLHTEQAATFKQITGAVFDPQSFIDAVFLQLSGVERELLFLPADKQQAARAALMASDLQEKITNPQREHQDYLHSDEYFEDKCKVLATVLTPAELEEYRLRSSRTASTLRWELQYFDCTPQEFKTLLELRVTKQAQKRFSDPPDRADEVLSMFGAQRAKEFARVTDTFYINARQTAEEQGLPLAQAERVWQITYDARAQAHRIVSDKSQSAETQKEILEKLFQQADSEVKVALGEKTSRLLRRDLSAAIRQVGPHC